MQGCSCDFVSASKVLLYLHAHSSHRATVCDSKLLLFWSASRVCVYLSVCLFAFCAVPGDSKSNRMASD